MEPKRGLLIRDCRFGDLSIRADSHVWIHGQRGENAELEFEGRRVTCPLKHIVEVPVPRPPLGELRKLDECFGAAPDAFEMIHHDQENMFRLLRCRKHGSYFLEDVRGQIGLYQRLILVEAESAANPRLAWRRYHAVSDDMLFYLGIAM